MFPPIKRQLALLVALGLAYLSGPGTADAAMVGYRFSGVITNSTDGQNIMGGDLSPGTPFSGWITFDSNTPDLYTDTDSGYYRPAVGTMRINLGSKVLVAKAPSLGVILHNYLGGDQIILGATQFQSSEIDFESMKIGLTDWTGSALWSDNLPSQPLELSQFDEYGFGLIGWSAPFKGGGSLTTFTTIPEPAVGWLLLLVGCLRHKARGTRA